MKRFVELEFHPLADIFPLMEGEEFDALVADIRATELRQGIMLYQGKILDGRNRYRACLAAGVKPWTLEAERYYGINDDAAATAYVISKNIHRHHLTAEQKRELIAKLIAAQPEKSDRQIGKQVKADHKTVGAVRKAKEATGEISPVEKRVGKDGKARKQPAKKKASEKARKRQEARQRKRHEAEVAEWEAQLAAWGPEEIIKKVEDFSLHIVNDVMHWIDTAKIDQGDRKELSEALHGCANDLSKAAQRLMGFDELADETAVKAECDASGDIRRETFIERAGTASGDAINHDLHGLEITDEVYRAANHAAGMWEALAKNMRRKRKEQSSAPAANADDAEASAEAMKAKHAEADAS